MATILDFEKPIMEIEKKIEEFKKISAESGMDLNKEIKIIKKIYTQILSLHKNYK